MNNYNIFRGYTGNGYHYTVETFRNAVYRHAIHLYSARNPQGLMTYSCDWQEALKDLIDLDQTVTPTRQHWSNPK